MYCGKCGAKMKIGSNFCTECGASVAEARPTPPAASATEAKPAPSAANVTPVQKSSAQKPDGPVGTGAAGSSLNGGQGAPKSAGKAEQNRMIGLIGAGIIAISLFLPFLTGSVGAFGFSVSKSSSLIGLLKSIPNGYVTIMILFFFIGVVAVCHILMLPKLSLIGVVLLFLLLCSAVGEMGNVSFDIGIASIQLGIGVWVYLIGVFVCIVAAFRKRG